MIVRFYDRQDPHNAANGSAIADASHLVTLIAPLRARPPFFCEFVNESGSALLVGIGGDIGCALFSEGDGKPPYSMARLEALRAMEGCVDFLVGETAMPVPARFCLPFAIIADVIRHFYATGLRSHAVEWEEI